MDKQYKAFLTDIMLVMEQHKVTDLLVVLAMNDQFRNTYLTKAEKPHEFFTSLSDGIDTWVKLKSKEYE